MFAWNLFTECVWILKFYFFLTRKSKRTVLGAEISVHQSSFSVFNVFTLIVSGATGIFHFLKYFLDQLDYLHIYYLLIVLHQFT